MSLLMVMAEKPREIAVRLLRQHAEEGGFIEQILEKSLTSAGLTQVDKGWFRNWFMAWCDGRKPSIG
jgi:hypothetical protein